MAKPKYIEWLKPHNLAKIENWAAKGLTYAEISHNMGVTRQTLSAWNSNHQDIFDAIKRGREKSIVCIENKAFDLALGEAYEEVVIKVKNADGGERLEVRKRKLPPNSTMLIFMLKNRCGYADNPNQQRAENADEEVKDYIRSIGLG